MCNKQSFTKKDAEAAIKKAKKSSKQYRKECRKYYCDRCNSWHLTSKEEGYNDKQGELPILHRERWKRLLNNH